MKQNILKRYGKVKWGHRDEKEVKSGLKDEKMFKWWNNEMMLHDLI